MYYEQNMNVVTFDTVSVGLYSQRSTLYHTISIERLRNVKLMMILVVTTLICVYLYYRYMINPDFAYVRTPMVKLGSKVEAYKELQYEKLQSDTEKMEALKKASTYN
ncbi:hypothetical protein STCU_01039 [Strigomonas culicis]|nr:hypothetical protein STCU_01039 [Strigomonas culicis]|eukprot:EPY35635.1 hypothetical protein STCU_01039 [Strigomonas culicis]